MMAPRLAFALAEREHDLIRLRHTHALTSIHAHVAIVHANA